jgi:hypothetical protein
VQHDVAVMTKERVHCQAIGQVCRWCASRRVGRAPLHNELRMPSLCLQVRHTYKPLGFSHTHPLTLVMTILTHSLACIYLCLPIEHTPSAERLVLPWEIYSNPMINYVLSCENEECLLFYWQWEVTQSWNATCVLKILVLMGDVSSRNFAEKG